jgi:uncharacterized membrane protein
MTARLRALWWRIAAGLWFVPAVTVLGAVLLGVGLVEAEVLVDIKLDERWPRLFGAGAEGSRGMLSAIAGSMITVAGVVFSVTIVALSLAASQYSPRVLRTFTSDRPTQLVLGVFVGIFAYCLVVLRTIRGGDNGGFVPSLAVLGGLLLAFVGIGFLVYFIHHLADSIQATSILSRVTTVTRAAIDELFPENLGAPLEGCEPEPLVSELGPWTMVAARRTGYVINVNNPGLLAFARERGRVLRMAVQVGEFVIEGQPLASLHGGAAVSEADQKSLDAHYTCDRQRTIEQDAAFGLQQLVDIGSKALSPGINDASTAVLCIDRLTELLVLLARRRIETPFRQEAGELRVIARGPSFESLVDLAYHTLRNDASAKPLVLKRLLWSIEHVALATSNRSRRRVLAAQVGEIAARAPRKEPSRDWQEILAWSGRLERELERVLQGQQAQPTSDPKASMCRGDREEPSEPCRVRSADT